jgi:arsenate reductase
MGCRFCLEPPWNKLQKHSLKTPPSRETLEAIVAAAGISARALLREKEAVFSELDLAGPDKTDAQLIDALARHPVLMQRPIVVTPLGTRLCRPAESVLEILPAK